MSGLILVAPLKGWSASLDEVPDAVFSARMLGDGLAIDPTGATLHAPCDGTIISIAAQKHAVTLRTRNGAEILLHVGIDTVELAGEGFKLHVTAGQTVHAGTPLLDFDLDWLARHAKSLVTPVIATDGERFRIIRRSQDREVDVGDFLFELQPVATTADEEVTRRVVMPLEHGIHARPAAQLASRAKGFSATIMLEAHGRTANARSAVAMMALGVRKGDLVTIHASGVDAAAAAADLEATMGSIVEAKSLGVASSTSVPVLSDSKTLRGVIACRGLAVGRAAHLSKPEIHVIEYGVSAAAEEKSLELARATVKARLRTLSGSGAQHEIVGAHLEFLDDPQLLESAQAWIARGKSAGYAWRAAIHTNIDTLRGLGDAFLAERADDFLDLESQVLSALAGDDTAAPTVVLPERAIVVAKELLPSQLVALDIRSLAGICISTGGPTSHVAILAAAMDIPTLVAMGPAILEIAADTPLVLDADEGLLRIGPEAAQIAAAEKTMSLRRERRSAEREAAQHEGRTADGVRIEVMANIGSVAEAQIAVAQGAEGCGLLRTEFLFIDRQSAPGVDEQARHYQQIADVFTGRPLVIRTLDVGGDKPVPYLQFPSEENPALGLRGIRVSLRRPDLLREQLHAVLRVRGPAYCRVMLPMITDASEIRAVRSVVESIRCELGYDGSIPIGAMIETPAAAINAATVAREADFLSIGTNDLAQYTLAIDRGHPELATLLNARHPAVLRLIAAVVDAAHAQGKPVAVCGGLASDPTAIPILIGLGIRELSAVPAVIPQLKSLIGTLTIGECRALASEALER